MQKTSGKFEAVIQDLNTASIKSGLKMNMKKTKMMAGPTTPTHTVTVNNITLEQVDECIYLGQRVSLVDRNLDNEIRRRIKAGWQAFGRHSTIMKGNLPICLKKKIFDQCILPTMTYAAETWTLSSNMEKNLQQHNITWRGACWTSHTKIERPINVSGSKQTLMTY